MPRCGECGLLTVKENMGTSYYEVDIEYRTNGMRYDNLKRGEPTPRCLVMACNLREEAIELSREGNKESDQVMKIASKDRECEKFVPWVPGNTPKEHLEMYHALLASQEAARQRERDREWESKQEAAAREWQIAQDEARREREDRRDKEAKERDDRRDKDNRDWQASQNLTNRKWQGVLGGIAAAVGLIGVFLGKYLSTPPAPPVIQVQPQSPVVNVQPPAVTVQVPPLSK